MTWKSEASPPEISEIINRWNDSARAVSDGTRTEILEQPTCSPESNLAVAVISHAVDEAAGKIAPVVLRQDQISIPAKRFLSGRSGNISFWLEVSGVRDPGYFIKILKERYR